MSHLVGHYNDLQRKLENAVQERKDLMETRDKAHNEVSRCTKEIGDLDRHIESVSGRMNTIFRGRPIQ